MENRPSERNRRRYCEKDPNGCPPENGAHAVDQPDIKGLDHTALVPERSSPKARNCPKENSLLYATRGPYRKGYPYGKETTLTLLNEIGWLETSRATAP